MFLDEIKLAEIMPCLADPDKIRFIAYLEKDISEVFPYLNAVLKNAIYNHEGKTITLKKEGRLISLHPGKIAAGKIIDEQDARDVLDWLKKEINCCYEKKETLTPSFERRQKLTALDIFKLLPGTNCRRCGDLTCLAFAVRLSAEDANIMSCQEIFAAPFADRKKMLLSLLAASGYVVPSAFIAADIINKEV